jgi:hypothetical protein
MGVTLSTCSDCIFFFLPFPFHLTGGVGRVSLFPPPPYRQPLLDIHTHPWPGGVSFLRKNPPPSVGFEPTSAGTATSEHCLRQPCGHRATCSDCIYFSFRDSFWLLRYPLLNSNQPPTKAMIVPMSVPPATTRGGGESRQGMSGHVFLGHFGL